MQTVEKVEKRKQQLREAKAREREVKKAAGLKAFEIWINPLAQRIVIENIEKKESEK